MSRRNSSSDRFRSQFVNSFSLAWDIMRRSKTSLVIMILFPVLAVVCTVEVAGENMFVTYSGTRSACFFLVCACIWGGLFNSVQLIVKQKDTLRQDLWKGLRPSCFILANALLQFILCAVQSAILMLCFPGVQHRYGNDPVGDGPVTGNVYADYFVSFLLLYFSADAMGMVISALVKKAETASVLSPYILIVQLILSGVLFPLNDVTEKISYLMLSRWGMESLGSVSDLNSTPYNAGDIAPELGRVAEDMYTATFSHVIEDWAIHIVFSFILLAVAGLFVRRYRRAK